MMDKDYQQRFSNAVLAAMMETGMSEKDGTRTVVMPAAEIIDSFATIMGLLLRDSEATASQSRTRGLCDDFARKLQRRINEAKRVPSPFETVRMGPLN